MVGELPTCLWYVFNAGLVGRVAAAHRQATTRNAVDSPSVGPCAIYISSVLISAAAQDEHRADHVQRKRAVFI